MRAEWKSRDQFAELAEAVGLPTDHIISAVNPPGTPGGTFVVLYSRDIVTKDTPVYSVVLVRDEQGILRRAAQERVIPDFWAGLRRTLGS
jgi:hypothetical protein